MPIPPVASSVTENCTFDWTLWLTVVRNISHCNKNIRSCFYFTFSMFLLIEDCCIMCTYWVFRLTYVLGVWFMKIINLCIMTPYVFASVIVQAFWRVPYLTSISLGFLCGKYEYVYVSSYFCVEFWKSHNVFWLYHNNSKFETWYCCSIGHRYDMSLPVTSHKTMKLHNINIRHKLARNVPMCPVCWKLVGAPIMDRSILRRVRCACAAGW